MLKGLINTINTLLTSDEVTLDTLQEIVDFIEINRDDLTAYNAQAVAESRHFIHRVSMDSFTGTTSRTISKIHYP